MYRKNLLFIIILLLVSCDQPEDVAEIGPDTPVKNVILMIGDGMGLAHINAARLKARQNNKTLTMDTLPVTGLVNTHSANKFITDSAAASTALATGHKTNNRMIAISPSGRKLKTILEAAKEKNMATGLVVTSSITHATPAAFAAHVDHRKQQALIAEQLLQNNVDVLLGGGKGFFLPESDVLSLRNDNQDLIGQARSQGYTIVDTIETLISSTDNKVLGLFAKEGLKFTDHEPSLAEMTRSALKRLANHPAGFLLVVEGSQIDWAAHHKDVQESIRQTLLFDDAVAIALAFARQNGETLLLVTADHETGGMAINNGKLDGSSLKIEWTTKHHTAIDVPIFAYGPKAIDFTGVMDNTIIPVKLSKYLRLELN